MSCDWSLVSLVSSFNSLVKLIPPYSITCVLIPTSICTSITPSMSWLLTQTLWSWLHFHQLATKDCPCDLAMRHLKFIDVTHWKHQRLWNFLIACVKKSLFIINIDISFLEIYELRIGLWCQIPLQVWMLPLICQLYNPQKSQLTNFLGS